MTSIHDTLSRVHPVNIALGNDLARTIDSYRRLVRAPSRRVAGSVLLARYADAVVDIVVPTITYGGLPRLSPDTTVIEFLDDGQICVDTSLDHGQLGPEADPWATARAVIARMMEQPISLIAEHVNAWPHYLWGSVSSAIADACERFSDLDGDVGLWAERIEAVIGADPRLDGLITMDTVEADGVTRLVHRRSTCCFASRLPRTQRCDGCSLRSPEEQRAGLLAQAAERGRPGQPVARDLPAPRRRAN